MAGFLFVHFTNDCKVGEQIYFSVSKDGLHWEELNYGKPVLFSQIGEKGVRDPFIVRDPKSNTFFLMATDLRIESGKGWEAAQEQGSRDIIIWESKDLVHWSAERSCTVGISDAGCVWAPEAVYDEEREAFFVFWASKVKKKEEIQGKQRMYASYTKDFIHFPEPFVWVEKDEDVIDATVIKEQGKYYRFIKDETTSRILLEVSESLIGEYKPIHSDTLSQLEGVEGPECYLLPDKTTWCLLVDQFASGQGYVPILIEDMQKGVMEKADMHSFRMGKSKKRHGGVITISDEEYERLIYCLLQKD